MTDITQTEIHPRIAEQLQALQAHIKELDIEASQVRGIAESAKDDSARLYKAFGRPEKVSSLSRTTAAIGGMSGIAIGCWLVAPALAWVVMGSILLGIVLVGSFQPRKDK